MTRQVKIVSNKLNVVYLVRYRPLPLKNHILSKAILDRKARETKLSFSSTL